MSIKDLLSSSKSKSMLVTLFDNGLLACLSSNTAIKLVVVYDITKSDIPTVKKNTPMKKRTR